MQNYYKTFDQDRQVSQRLRNVTLPVTVAYFRFRLFMERVAPSASDSLFPGGLALPPIKESAMLNDFEKNGGQS